MSLWNECSLPGQEGMLRFVRVASCDHTPQAAPTRALQTAPSRWAEPSSLAWSAHARPVGHASAGGMCALMRVCCAGSCWCCRSLTFRAVPRSSTPGSPALAHFPSISSAVPSPSTAKDAVIAPPRKERQQQYEGGEPLHGALLVDHQCLGREGKPGVWRWSSMQSPRRMCARGSLPSGTSSRGHGIVSRCVHWLCQQGVSQIN